MEYLVGMIVLVIPIYRFLLKIEKRLTRVETKVDFLYEKNGGKG